MITVAIPTYNYNVYPLVREAHKQLDKTGVPYEILVYDDASTQTFDTTDLLLTLSNVVYKKMPANLGRLALRYQMASEARYDWVLFMDADMFPKDRFFMAKLLKTIENKTADVYFGGIDVPANPPSPQKILRWKYGKERESLPLDIRQKNPYKSLISGSICFNKNIFLTEAQVLLPLKKYGLDAYFSYLLKKHDRTVVHYQNPATHLGFEDNPIFIKKTEEALQTYNYLISKKLMPTDYIKVTSYGQNFKKWTPSFVRQKLYRLIKPLLCRNLLSRNPSLFVFDIYKLLYYSQINLS